MDFESLFGANVYTWAVIPILIVLARMGDVSLGTMRIICIGRGYKAIAPLLGFFEILIWLVAIRQIMQDLTNVFYYLVYAGGFAAGTFVGMYIEDKLAIGILSIRIITKKDASKLIGYLRSKDYGVTSVEAQGGSGLVHIIYVVVNRSDIERVSNIINRFNPNAFYTVEDVRSAREGVFPLHRSLINKEYFRLLWLRKKGK